MAPAPARKPRELAATARGNGRPTEHAGGAHGGGLGTGLDAHGAALPQQGEDLGPQLLPIGVAQSRRQGAAGRLVVSRS